ncbi:MAG TPA: 16S rRNA (adenine(1518)-N(6)/adenine(1519)-N(6))-dimethyltransferase RsmA [Trueperaceae bacterium]
MSDARPLYSPAVVRELLQHHGLRANKSFGQNFLIDGNTLRKIVDSAGIRPEDTALEIGPGLGVLTRALAERAARVISVELDSRLLPVLQETLAAYPNVVIVQGDGLNYDLTQLPPDSLMVANLPYNVATPILVRALESGCLRRLVFLVQREVAERLVAGPGEEAYGALSLKVAHFAEARVVGDVGPAAFFPPPAVTSSIVRLDRKPGVLPDPTTFRLVEIAFAHRRKTLKKNLVMAGFEAGAVTAALAALGLDSRVRAEDLGLASFRELAAMLLT